MKKTIILILTILLAALLVSCGAPKTAEKAYSKIIDQYVDLLEKKQDGKSLPESYKDETKNAILAAVNACDDPALMGYATKDINGDGTEELFLISKDSDMYALFTLVDSKPVLLEVFDGGRGAIDHEGTVYSWSGVNTSEDYYNRYRISDGAFEGVRLTAIRHEGGENEYFCDFFGEKRSLTPAEWDNLIQYYNKHSIYENPKDQTRMAGLRIIPALGEIPENGAPEADASTYEGIIELYKTAVSCLSDYTREDWMAGKYDEKLTFADDNAYELYNRILCSAYRLRPRDIYKNIDYLPNGDSSYGYMLKDIGGDEGEELILLNDGYSIIAIFTVRDGVPTLLYNYCSGTELSIDINGNFSYQAMYGTVRYEYRTYCINDAGEFELIGFYGVHTLSQTEAAYYTVEDGKYVIGNKNDYSQVVSSIIRGVHPAPYATRYCLGDGFIPLFERVKPDRSYENKIIRRSGVVGELPQTISNVTENSFDFSFKYVRTYLANPTDTAFTNYETEIKASATAEGDHYRFDNGTVSGKVFFGVDIIWIDIETSTDPNIECYPLMFEVAQSAS